MSVRLRRITESDKELLFQWTNDPETRKQSFSTEPIPWETHVAWFERKMRDPGCYHYLMLDGDVPVGVARLDRDQTENDKNAAGSQKQYAYLISVNMAPDMRGRGYAKKMFGLLERQALAEIPDSSYLYGEIKTENIASRKGVEAAGYQIVSETRDEVICRCSLDHERTVYFRADGNAVVGYGHLMRCLTIADACRTIGLQPVFLMADHGAEDIVFDRGYPVVILETPYDQMAEELARIRKCIRDNAVMVLDSYHLTQDYIEILKEDGHKLVWMDDLGEEHYPVDMLINYNLYAGSLGYGSQDKEEQNGCEYLLGTRYAPVREQFCEKEYHVQKEIRRILITTGASDPYGAGILFAKALLERKIPAQISVVCGAYNPYIAELKELEQESSMPGGFSILQNLTDLSEVMRNSDLVIAAAGSTVYELCAVGVPSVVYYFADNQKMGADAFAGQAGSVNLGDLRVEGRQAGERAYRAVCMFMGQPEREALSTQMQKLVDGKGAQRIAEAIRKLTGRE